MTEKILGGEFIEREQQLPPEDSPGYVAQGSSTEGAQADLSETPLGTPPICFDVRSVYDSRPVAGYDFMIPVTTTVELGSTFTGEFTVRQGFVAVLREVSHFFTDDPQPPILNRNQCLLSLKLNGADVRDNVDVPVGVSSDAIWKGFILADEFNVLGAEIALQGGLTATECIVVFYGNYLRKTGIAFPFEIANRTANCGPPPEMALPTVPAKVAAPSPATMVSAPLPPRGPEVPPFRVQWMRPAIVRAAAGGRNSGGRMRTAGTSIADKYGGIYPAYSNSQPLSEADQKRYAEYLNATRPR